MKNLDFLPETWAKTAYYRYRKFRREQLVTPPNNKMDFCQDCPGFRVSVYPHYFITYCVFDKCIKQYPHKTDNGEFT